MSNVVIDAEIRITGTILDDWCQALPRHGGRRSVRAGVLKEENVEAKQILADPGCCPSARARISQRGNSKPGVDTPGSTTPRG